MNLSYQTRPQANCPVIRWPHTGIKRLTLSIKPNSALKEKEIDTSSITQNKKTQQILKRLGLIIIIIILMSLSVYSAFQV